MITRSLRSIFLLTFTKIRFPTIHRFTLVIFFAKGEKTISLETFRDSLNNTVKLHITFDKTAFHDLPKYS